MQPEQQLHTAMLQMESATRDMHRLGLGLIFLYVVLLLLALAGTCFWIWMLVDCIKRKKENALVGWVLLMVVLTVPGAIVYYFAGRDREQTENAFSEFKSTPKKNLFSGTEAPAETISKVEPSPGGLTVHFQNGQAKAFHWMDFPKLLNVHSSERAKWRISSDRKKLFWPELQQHLDYASLFLR